MRILRLGSSLLTSPFLRRESLNYVSFLVKNRMLGRGIAQAARGARFLGAARVAPEGFSLSGKSGHPPEEFSYSRQEDFPSFQAGQVGSGGEESHIPERHPWKGPFSDVEEEYLGHRFGWLLPILADGVTAKGLLSLLRMAEAWDREHPGPSAAGWDSYSLSERAVHWIFLLRAALSRGVGRREIESLNESLARQLDGLRRHLEFRGPATNNHLINNGRALYAGGLWLGDERFRQLGKEILAYGARTLFRPSGFLRESSSHYHLLLCRSYLEAFWMAGGKADQKFWEGLKDRLVDMTRASAFFLRSGYFPRIGDVSPDFPTAFHRGIPAVGAAVLAEDSVSLPPPEEIGWHSFFLPSGASEEKERPPLPEIEGWEDAGYYRLVKGKWELFVYLNPDGHVPAWSHGHSDLLGFLLMYGGHPVLVDSGRATYADNPLGHYGRGASSHNTFRVDGLAPCLVHAHNGYVPLMMKEYFAYPAEVRIERREDGLKARLMCSGYQRIALGIRVERVFLLGEGGLRIIDEVLGSGRHLLESFFHFHPDVGVRRKGQDALGLSLPGGEELEFLGKVDPDESVVLEKGKESGDVMGWYSPEYGEAIPCWSFLLRGRRSLPLHRSWTIRPAHR